MHDEAVFGGPGEGLLVDLVHLRVLVDAGEGGVEHPLLLEAEGDDDVAVLDARGEVVEDLAGEHARSGGG